MDTTTLLPLALTLLVGLALGALVGVLWVRARTVGTDGAALAALEQRAADQAVVKEGLERLQDQMRDLDHQRTSWQAQLAEQVSDMRRSTETLRQETRGLSTALRKPQVRGQWGEMQLRRTVELAGMVDHCDFEEQERYADGARRPDLVVHLAGERKVVVDSKVPLSAFLDACEAQSDDDRAAHLARHARQVRTHIDQLSSKQYWRSLDDTPEFVVLFLPAEAFLSAALGEDRDLLEHASRKKVVLATPTTLIALLRTVAQGWHHEALAERTRELHALGLEVFERLGTMTQHLDGVGRSLTAAVKAYNDTVGSMESRLMVTGRKLGEIASPEAEITSPRQVEAATRRLTLATDEPAPARRAHGA